MLRPQPTLHSGSQQIVLANVDPTFTWDAVGQITGWNQAVADLAGWPVSALHGMQVGKLFPGVPADTIDAVRTAVAEGEDIRHVELDIARPDGSRLTYSLAAAPIRDEAGHIDGGVASLRDITTMRAEMDRLRDTVERYRTLIDHSPAVTYTEDVETGIVSASPQILPLTGFTQRLAATLRDVDTISRFGGDEFAILLGQIDDLSDAISVAERVRAALEPAMMLENRQIIVTASIGIAHADESVQTPDDLLRRSDIAMYRAKREGRNRIAVFDAALHEAALRRLEVESDLRRGIAEAQFELHFQPIYTLATAEVAGFEALLRWNHPTRGRVQPGDFIPVAEDSGLIVPIGKWVLETACRTAVEWRDRTVDRAPVRISVNLSPRQFQQPDLVDEVEATLHSSGLDPDRLTIEVTESVIMDDIELTVSRLRELKALGVRIAIDDFGTGYSSLTYVKRFPVDVLKIDRSFVSGLGVTTADAAIVSATLTLAHTLGISVVAEGVETTLQRDTLVSLGCDGAQGYYFSRPVPAADARTLLS